MNPSNRIASITNNNVLGISENEFHVYPNPAQNHIQIEWGKEYSSATQVLVYDAMGMLVCNEAVKREQSQLKVELPESIFSGMYHVQLIGQDRLLVNKKIIVNR